MDEAVTNIIMHGYRGAEKPIEIDMAREGDDLVVRIYDEAPLYDPTAEPPPDLSLPLGRTIHRRVGRPHYAHML